MALPKHLQSALHKYAFDPKNPTGAGLPKSMTAPKPMTPAAPAGGLGGLGSTPTQSLLSGGPSLGGNGGGTPLVPPQPKPTGLASASIGAPGTNNNNFLTQPSPTNSLAGGSNSFMGATTPTLSLSGAAPVPTQSTLTTGGSAPSAPPPPAATPAPAAPPQTPLTPMSTMSLNADGSVGTSDPSSQFSPAVTLSGGSTGAVNATVPGQETQPAPAATTTQTPKPQQAQPGFANNRAQWADRYGRDSNGSALSPTHPEAQKAVTASLTDENIPQAQRTETGKQVVKDVVDAAPPADKQGMQDLHAGKETPEAKEFKGKVDAAVEQNAKDEIAKKMQEDPNMSPQQAGGMMNGIMESFNNMPEPMKWMMGLGLGGGLIGILGSMFGGGGGMGMLGLLGLGAAGLAGAGGGMFGQGAQNFMADAIGGIGKSMGMIPEKLTDEQKQLLLAKDPVAAATAYKGVPTRDAAGKQVAGARQQLGQVQMLNNMGGMSPRLLEGMGLSPEEAQLAARNVGTLSSQYSDQNSALNQHLRTGEEYSKPTWGSWWDEVRSIPWRQKPASDQRVLALARQWVKESRCWKGYEPVPGKAPFSEDSCRPVGSAKKKKKKTEKTAEEVADEWLKKYRARGQKGRWLNTRRGNKTELKVSHN